MANITPEYVENLPDIYRHIFNVFGIYNPGMEPGRSLAWQTIYSTIKNEHSFDEVAGALQQLVDHDVLIKVNNIFYQPTEIGDEIIRVSRGGRKSEPVPPFSPPPT